jgi:hypothetical protein
LWRFRSKPAADESARVNAAENPLLRLAAVGDNGAILATPGIFDWVMVSVAVGLLLFGVVDEIRSGPRWPTPTAWPQHPAKRLDKPVQESELR